MRDGPKKPLGVREVLIRNHPDVIQDIEPLRIAKPFLYLNPRCLGASHLAVLLLTSNNISIAGRTSMITTTFFTSSHRLNIIPFNRRL